MYWPTKRAESAILDVSTQTVARDGHCTPETPNIAPCIIRPVKKRKGPSVESKPRNPKPRTVPAKSPAKPARPSAANRVARPAGEKRYWLFKTEPEAFSIDDLARAKTTFWDGVRNYQARNTLRDDVKLGDEVLVYHSNADPMGIAGRATVVREGYPDHTAFEKGHVHFDPDSQRDEPTWFMVDVKHAATFPRVVTRDDLSSDPVCSQMGVLRRANRLSIQPVTPEQFVAVLAIANR